MTHEAFLELTALLGVTRFEQSGDRFMPKVDFYGRWMGGRVRVISVPFSFRDLFGEQATPEYLRWNVFRDLVAYLRELGEPVPEVPERLGDPYPPPPERLGDPYPPPPEQLERALYGMSIRQLRACALRKPEEVREHLDHRAVMDALEIDMPEVDNLNTLRMARNA